MRYLLVLVLVLLSGALMAEPVVTQASVTSEQRGGRTWTRLQGTVEAETDLPLAPLMETITDWSSYPRLFPAIQSVSLRKESGIVYLSEVTKVSVLGYQVTNRFTLRIQVSEGPEQASVTWTQESSDGTVDGLEGGWELSRKSGKTFIRYRNNSAVPQAFLGQDSLVGLFFPGEIKQVVNSVLNEAKKKEET